MKLKFFDSTLRDGSHVLKQQMYPSHIEQYCEIIDDAGMYAVFVGHGNGLGASSILMTRSYMDEIEMLKVARKKLKSTKLGAFFTVGYGTFDNQLKPAADVGTDVFLVACHSSEADVTKAYIEYLSKIGKEIYGVLMNAHMTSLDVLLRQCELMREYGAKGAILMDSAGSFTPVMVSKVVTLLCEQVKCFEIGFHAHNNLSMAVSNTYAALSCGASIVDGTVAGFGSGAGNCQLEALLALLKKQGQEADVDLYKLLDVNRDIIQGIFGYSKGINGINIVSGLSGVVSTITNRVEETAKEYGVDPRSIFVELGKRKVIVGQDDLIIEIAQTLRGDIL